MGGLTNPSGKPPVIGKPPVTTPAPTVTPTPTGSPFSGGTGQPTGNPQSQAAIDFAAMFSAALAVAYVVDREGLNIGFKFQGDGTALIYNGGEIFTLPYKRVKL